METERECDGKRTGDTAICCSLSLVKALWLKSLCHCWGRGGWRERWEWETERKRERGGAPGANSTCWGDSETAVTAGGLKNTGAHSFFFSIFLSTHISFLPPCVCDKFSIHLRSAPPTFISPLTYSLKATVASQRKHQGTSGTWRRDLVCWLTGWVAASGKKIRKKPHKDRPVRVQGRWKDLKRQEWRMRNRKSERWSSTVCVCVTVWMCVCVCKYVPVVINGAWMLCASSQRKGPDSGLWGGCRHTHTHTHTQIKEQYVGHTAVMCVCVCVSERSSYGSTLSRYHMHPCFCVIVCHFKSWNLQVVPHLHLSASCVWMMSKSALICCWVWRLCMYVCVCVCVCVRAKEKEIWGNLI